MSRINPTAETAREQARHTDGRFGEQPKNDPGQLDLGQPTPAPLLVTYDMYADRLQEAQQRVDRANKRLAKHGITQQFELETEPYTTTITTPDNREIEVERVKVTLNRPTISYGGFTFLARIEQLDTGDYIAYQAPNITLEDWQPTSMDCQHCDKKRTRTKAYAVRDEHGQIRVVGGTCVELYTGLKPEGLVALQFDLDDLEESDADWRSSPRGQQVFDTDRLLRLAWVITKETGYQGAYSDHPTRGLVMAAMYPNPSNRDEIRWARQVQAEADGVDGAQVRAEAAEAVEGATSDWAQNVSKLLRTERVNHRAVGTLVSSMAAVHKARERKARRREWAAGFVGQPGERLRDVEATVVSVWSDDEFYGWQEKTVRKVTMQSESGHRVFWKSYGDAPKPGDRIRFTATVKDTSTYEGVDSTRITRTKFEVLTSADSPPAN